MGINDLDNELSLEELLDQLDDEGVSYTTELESAYFLCSRHYWDTLPPDKQLELLEEHPHLEDYFAE